MRQLLSIFLLGSVLSCSQAQDISLDLLIGEWKRENKDRFEVWEKDKGSDLKGYSYKIEEGKKVIWERLSIKEENGELIFRARVADQNEGAVIPFKLNKNIKGLFSFENPAHDFPKMLRYTPLKEGVIKVEVMGKEGEGFSYIQHKQ
ncbi:MAG: DUF6265 family protein [Bacteroidota bacterium]